MVAAPAATTTIAANVTAATVATATSEMLLFL